MIFPKQDHPRKFINIQISFGIMFADCFNFLTGFIERDWNIKLDIENQSREAFEIEAGVKSTYQPLKMT